MYEPEPAADMLAGLGFCAADFADDEIKVWTCNLRAVRLFAAVSTQWRAGFAGAVGLDYTAVHSAMEITGIKKKHRAGLLDDIRLMEAAVLEMWREQNND